MKYKFLNKNLLFDSGVNLDPYVDPTPPDPWVDVTDPLYWTVTETGGSWTGSYYSIPTMATRVTLVVNSATHGNWWTGATQVEFTTSTLAACAAGASININTVLVCSSSTAFNAWTGSPIKTFNLGAALNRIDFDNDMFSEIRITKIRVNIP